MTRIAAVVLALMVPTFSNAETIYRLLGDGYAQIVNKQELNGNVGLGIGYSTDVEEGMGMFHWGTVDTITNAPKAAAAFVLTPGESQYSWSLHWRRTAWKLTNVWNWGFSGFASAGKVTWAVSDPASSDPTALIEKDADAYSGGFGPCFRLLAPGLAKNKLKVFVSAFLTGRTIGGDARERGFRSLALNGTSRDVVGGQIEGEFWVNDVFVRVTLTRFTGDIVGLSGGNFFITAGLRDGVIIN